MNTLTSNEFSTCEIFFDNGSLLIKIMKMHTIHKTEIPHLLSNLVISRCFDYTDHGSVNVATTYYNILLIDHGSLTLTIIYLLYFEPRRLPLSYIGTHAYLEFSITLHCMHSSCLICKGEKFKIKNIFFFEILFWFQFGWTSLLFNYRVVLLPRYYCFCKHAPEYLLCIYFSVIVFHRFSIRPKT